MITELEIEKKFDKIVTSDEIKNLQSISIFEITTNKYLVFGKYYIYKKSKNNVDVLTYGGDLIHSFSNLRNAICWCIYDIRGRYNSCNRIIALDRNISSEEVQISVHERLFKKSKKMEDKLIFLAKLNEEKLKRKEMYNELEEYIHHSDIWQKKKYRLKTEY